jgi:hypothetical protein
MVMIVPKEGGIDRNIHHATIIEIEEESYRKNSA